MMLNMDMPAPSGPHPASVAPTMFGFVSWDGSGHQRACPLATFGCPRDAPLSLTARLVCVDPPRADCAEIANARDVAGAIALVVRGGCSFADKARRVQAAGAIAMVLANNTREEPDAAFTMAEDELPLGTAPPFPAITIPCVMMCLLDVRELFQKFPPTAQSGVLTLEVLGHNKAAVVAAESLRLRQEMKRKFEEQQSRGGGGGWGVGSALKRKTTALIKLMEPQSAQMNGSPSASGESGASTTAPTTETHDPVVKTEVSRPLATPDEQLSTDATRLTSTAVNEIPSTTVLPAEKPTPLVAFMQWATSADAYHLEFAPLADFCRVRDGAVFDGPLVVCDPVLANTDHIANAAELRGSVALVKRGACTFPAKLERVQACGAIAAIVGNDDASDPDAAFVMSVDSITTDHITIAAVMVSSATFQRLTTDKAARIRVLCVAAGPAAADLLARSGSASLIGEADQEAEGDARVYDDEEDAYTNGVEELSGAQISLDDFDNGARAFHAACRVGDHELCLRPIGTICGNNEDLTRKLISKRDSNWRRALHHACTGGNERTVELLLQRGASPFDVDLAAQTALHVASAHAHTRCVELLLQAASSSSRADEDDDGRLRLLTADIGGSTPIHLATIAGSTDTLEVLLTASAQVAEDGTYKFDGVNERNADGATPLHLTCRYERADCAVYLLAVSADVNAIDSSSYSPLAISCEMINECADGNASDSLYIIEKLIAAGATMDQASMLGTSGSTGCDNKSSSDGAGESAAANERLLLDRIDSPAVKRDVEVLYLRHEVRALRSTLRTLQHEKSKLSDRVDSLDRSIAQLQRQDEAHLTATEQQNAQFKCQIDQLQCQMSSLLQLLRVNSDASRLIGGNCSDLSLIAAVSDSLFASSPGRLFTDRQGDSGSTGSAAAVAGARDGGHDEEAPKHHRTEASSRGNAASQQDLALDAGLARDLGKKLLRQRQFDLAEAYFARSLEIMPLPGVAQLRDKARAAQQGDSNRAAAPATGTTTSVEASSEARDSTWSAHEEPLSPASKEATIQRLIAAIVASGAPEHVRTSLEREVNKLKTIPGSSNEFELACKWLQWLTTLPWGDPTSGLASAASRWEPWARAGSTLDTFLELERLEQDHEHHSKDRAARSIQRAIRQ